MKTLTCLLTLVLASGPLFSAVPVHVVKSGDTLYSIARANNLSTAKLAELNQIADRSNILVGQTLTLGAAAAPAPVSSSSSYTVVPGDTFYSIARRHQLSVAKLKSYNPRVEVTHIVIGQELATRPGAAPAPVKIAIVEKTPAPVKKIIASSKTISTTSAPKKSTSSKTVVKSIAPKPTASKPTPAPTSKPEPELKKETVAKTEDPKSTPARDEVVTPPASVKSIIITKDTKFEDFSTKYQVSTQELNKLNGWNLPSGTILANGSEVFIPKG